MIDSDPIRPSTLHPDYASVRPTQRTFLAPAVQVQYPVPQRPIVRNPDIPLVNQANITKPVFPSIGDNVAPHRVVVEVDSDDLPQYPRPEPLYCYYPEYFYLGLTLPTRNPGELAEFLQHCRLINTNNGGIDFHLLHPLTETRQFTSSTLNFENLLWKSRTLVTPSQVVEEYQWIRRLQRTHRPDKAYLEPAYKVTYAWNQEGWTVERFFGNPRHRG